MDAKTALTSPPPGLLVLILLTLPRALIIIKIMAMARLLALQKSAAVEEAAVMPAEGEAIAMLHLFLTRLRDVLLVMAASVAQRVCSLCPTGITILSQWILIKIKATMDALLKLSKLL